MRISRCERKKNILLKNCKNDDLKEQKRNNKCKKFKKSKYENQNVYNLRNCENMHVKLLIQIYSTTLFDNEKHFHNIRAHLT